MTRKEFIQSRGATCSNWTWSWSFVNHRKRRIIFGLWSDHRGRNEGLILRRSWEWIRSKGKMRRQPGYKQAVEHLRLVEQGYRLYTFALTRAKGTGPTARIKSSENKLSLKKLKRTRDSWFAISTGATEYRATEEVDPEDPFYEGGYQKVAVNKWERNPEAREACLAKYGYRCQVCSFDYERTYGSRGRLFIHVHHVVEISRRPARYQIDPVRDLIPVCANCHAMIHKSPPLTVAQLKRVVRGQRKHRDG